MARTVIPDLVGETGGLVVDSPGFELVSIDVPFHSGMYVEIPLHLVPDVLTALMKAARHAAVDLPAGDRGGYLAARARSL